MSDMAPVLYIVEPELGDLIEIFRGFYQHWAVYVGDGFVVNLASPFEERDGRSTKFRFGSVFANQSVVKREKLWDVVGTDQWRINNSSDNMYEPRPSYIIMKEANALVGELRPYGVFRDNCEHFVNDLRYGKAISLQVQEVIKVLSSVILPFLIFGVKAALTYIGGGPTFPALMLLA